MGDSQCRWEFPDRWSERSQWLSVGLHGHNRPPRRICDRWLPVLMVGILLAGGRRTVISWLCAAGVGEDFDNYSR